MIEYLQLIMSVFAITYTFMFLTQSHMDSHWNICIFSRDASLYTYHSQQMYWRLEMNNFGHSGYQNL